MVDRKIEELKIEQHKPMQKYEQLEALQAQRSNKSEFFHCLEKEIQALDEEADRIRWILENDL